MTKRRYTVHKQIRAELEKKSWQTCGELAGKLRLPPGTVRQALTRMEDVHFSQAGYPTRWALQNKKANSAGGTGITLLQRGAGDRREDCKNYMACLTNLIRASPHESGQAHCPKGCAEYTPLSREDLISEAVVARQTQLSMTAL